MQKDHIRRKINSKNNLYVKSILLFRFAENQGWPGPYDKKIKLPLPEKEEINVEGKDEIKILKKILTLTMLLLFTFLPDESFNNFSISLSMSLRLAKCKVLFWYF